MKVDSKFSYVAVGVVLAGSALFTAFQCLRLTKQLNDANSMINALEAGSLHNSSAVPSFNGDVSLTPLDAGLRTDTTGPRCDACDHKSGSDSLSKAAIKAMRSTRQLSLLDLKHRYIAAEPDRRFTLFIFYSPTDCPACLKESAAWERLASAGPSLDLSVVGIVDRCSSQEADSARHDMGLTFPVLFDQQSALRILYRILRTPQKVLVDRSGKVLLASPPDQTPEGQDAFEHQVRAVCERR
jgi:peroxiredoxin